MVGQKDQSNLLMVRILLDLLLEKIKEIMKANIKTSVMMRNKDGNSLEFGGSIVNISY